MSPSFRFADFLLEPDDRRLSRLGSAVDINGRYLDALALLVREQGALVTKDRFMEEVWHGVPVTDEALTQCIRTLRRLLGDSATAPRFIETVPKHGYRFIAPVEQVLPSRSSTEASARQHLWSRVIPLGAAAAAGGAVAGLLGGLFYGFALALQPLPSGAGGMSVLLVLICVNILIGSLGGAGVGAGMAAAGFARGRGSWKVVAGAALGGMVVGAAVKLIGLDAFNLLFGRSPAGITGAWEGAVLGAGVGAGVWATRFGSQSHRMEREVAFASVGGALAGLGIALLGGRLMSGSLDLLVSHFPASRLRLDGLGSLFGEQGFGPVSQLATATLEGAVFGGCIVAAMSLATRGISHTARNAFG